MSIRSWIFVAITFVFVGAIGYMKAPDLFIFYKKEVAKRQPIPVEEEPIDKQVLQDSEFDDTPKKKDPNEKVWVEGKRFEWRVPEDVSEIIIKYKESNGRLILDYNFKVNPGERIEIQAK